MNLCASGERRMKNMSTFKVYEDGQPREQELSIDPKDRVNLREGKGNNEINF